MPRPKYLEDVVTLNLNQDKCIGCKRCVEVCPHAVFSMNETKAKIADRNACMECGACAQNCPVAAITVQPGVGCATGVMLSYLKGKKTSCGSKGDDVSDSCCDTQKSSCC